MKRFYCTICKRPRRVRKFPSNISSPNAPSVMDRTGTCVWHDPLYQPVRSIKQYARTVTATASVAKSSNKSKAGR